MWQGVGVLFTPEAGAVARQEAVGQGGQAGPVRGPGMGSDQAPPPPLLILGVLRTGGGGGTQLSYLLR